MAKACLYCNKDLEGRVDKKFCTSYCKSSYHYQKNKESEDSLFQKIDRHLKTNRRLLKEYNKAGLATVRKEKLINNGFNPTYFTHYWKNKEDKVYLFCYEYGFLDIKDKYVLVTWQKYMDR
ncbi:hypothetical protein [Aquimarina sediminis]|uniref:hypothetical protein n=1 Tax=Aquimarina sediminis TaxID=2070536 RepID=UPI000CA0532B|nr:hypothetical protein [Aquimarina sediminis]